MRLPDNLLFSPLTRLMAWTRPVWHGVGGEHGQAASAVILPPETPGSLGDQALLASLISSLRAQQVTRIGVIAFSRQEKWESVGQIDELLTIRPQLPWRDAVSLLRRWSPYSSFYYLGADMVDGHYDQAKTLQRLRLVRLAAQAGLRTTIVGFSFNAHPQPSAVSALRDLPGSVRLCCRGGISQQRVQQVLPPGRHVELVADVAFCLPATHDTPWTRAIAAWIHEQNAHGHSVVGVNASIQVAKQAGLTPHQLIVFFSDVMEKLASQHGDLSFLLLPHDFRNQMSDLALNQRIWETLPAALQSRTLLAQPPFSAAEVKGVVGELAFVFSSRMHLAIASLGQGTPAACLTYQDKFEDLFEHFSLRDMTCDPRHKLEAANVSTWLGQLIQTRQALRRQIESALPRVQRLALASVHPLDRGTAAEQPAPVPVSLNA